VVLLGLDCPCLLIPEASTGPCLRGAVLLLTSLEGEANAPLNPKPLFSRAVKNPLHGFEGASCTGLAAFEWPQPLKSNQSSCPYYSSYYDMNYNSFYSSVSLEVPAAPTAQIQPD
jgi:hypothetical protein